MPHETEERTRSGDGPLIEGSPQDDQRGGAGSAPPADERHQRKTRKRRPVPAIEDIQRHFAYDPGSGEIRWKLRYGSKQFPGNIAGYISKEGYVSIYFRGVILYGHRIAWILQTGSWPKEDIDHVNGIRSDNRLFNLREASRAQNLHNTSVRKGTVSGLKGVCWHKHARKWLAQIRHQGVHKYLGVYATKEEAAAAYRDAALKLHGEFARF